MSPSCHHICYAIVHSHEREGSQRYVIDTTSRSRSAYILTNRATATRSSHYNIKMSRSGYVPSWTCPEVTMSRNGYVPKRLCPETAMSRNSYVPKRLCPEVTMSRNGYVPKRPAPLGGFVFLEGGFAKRGVLTNPPNPPPPG